MLSHCVGRLSLRNLLPLTTVHNVRYAHVYKAKTFTPRPDGPNYLIVQYLINEFETESQKDDFSSYKARAFQRAIKALDEIPEAIESGSQAQKVPNIGNGISRRIEEFLNPSGQSSSNSLLSGSADHDDVVRERLVREFTKVPGVGPVKARKLFDCGCRSLEDLRKTEFSSLLSSSSKAVLDFVGHLDQRIPRSHVDNAIDVIKSVVSSEMRIHSVGDHRRGHSSCSDIDIILFHPSCVYVPRPGEKPSETSGHLRSSKRGRPLKSKGHTGNQKSDSITFLREIVLGPLEREGIIAATLAEGQRKWQGIIRIPKEGEVSLERVRGVRDRQGDFRKMDITLYPILSEGAALLASTGDADFNSHLRKIASSMGLRLNEFGLWRHYQASSTPLDDSPESLIRTNMKGDGTEEGGRWELIASKTEQEIFDELNVEYVEPQRRNFSYIATKMKSSKRSK